MKLAMSVTKVCSAKLPSWVASFAKSTLPNCQVHIHFNRRPSTSLLSCQVHITKLLIPHCQVAIATLPTHQIHWTARNALQSAQKLEFDMLANAWKCIPFQPNFLPPKKWTTLFSHDAKF
jgi:hypothetical protein